MDGRTDGSVLRAARSQLKCDDFLKSEVQCHYLAYNHQKLIPHLDKHCTVDSRARRSADTDRVYVLTQGVLFPSLLRNSGKYKHQTDSHVSTQTVRHSNLYVDGLAQDCSNAITNALELLQSCYKPSILSSMYAITFNDVVIHRRNTLSAKLPPVIAFCRDSHRLFAHSPLPPGYCSAGGHMGAHLDAFEATFDKLQLIRTTLISRMIKTL